MLLGAFSALLMFGAGFAALRLLGLQRDRVMVALAPAVGLGVLAVLCTFAQQWHTPEAGIGFAVLGVSGIGVLLAAPYLKHDPKHRVAAGMLAAATLIPALVLSSTLWVQSGVPDYSYDGPFHAETIEAMRHGATIAGAGWYPTGFHAPIAAILSLVPSVDSATGGVAWAAGLTLVAPLVVFGFTTAIWGNRRVAAAAALLLALTSTFPYGLQIYSEWPMLAGLLLVVGIWTLTASYLKRPNTRVALLAGLLAGAMVLVHGTEVYTTAIGLVALAVVGWRVLLTRRAVRDLALAGLIAAACVAPYLPALTSWTASGGAVAVGSDYYLVHQATTHHEPLLEALFWASSFSSGVLVDAPFRLLLVAMGAWLAFRRRQGRVLVVLAAVFVALVAVFRFVDIAIVRDVFALTLPWAVDGRLLTTVSILVAPIGGLGLVWTATHLWRTARTATSTSRRRAFARRAVVVGAAIGVASVGLNAAKFNLETTHIVTYSADDDAAFAWLRQHAQQGDMLMNDGAADAGIWAPYKADVQIVLPHSRSVAPDSPEDLVRSNLNQLNLRQDVSSAACALGIKYVYHGEANSTSEQREFPSLQALRSNPALVEVFSRGEAAVFQMRATCA